MVAAVWLTLVLAVFTREFQHLGWIVGYGFMILPDYFNILCYYSRWQRLRVRPSFCHELGSRVKVSFGDGLGALGTVRYHALRGFDLETSKGYTGGGHVVRLDDGKKVCVTCADISPLSPLEQLAECAG